MLSHQFQAAPTASTPFHRPTTVSINWKSERTRPSKRSNKSTANWASCSIIIVVALVSDLNHKATTKIRVPIRRSEQQLKINHRIVGITANMVHALEMRRAMHLQTTTPIQQQFKKLSSINNRRRSTDWQLRRSSIIIIANRQRQSATLISTNTYRFQGKFNWKFKHSSTFRSRYQIWVQISRRYGCRCICHSIYESTSINGSDQR